MNHGRELIEQIADIIYLRLRKSFTPDSDTLHFLKTSYGINTAEDFQDFLHDKSLNDGTIYELTVYPDDILRVEIEKIIPSAGLTLSEIDSIRDILREKSPSVSILTHAGAYCIDSENSSFCIANFIKKLNLDRDLQYLGNEAESSSSELFFKSRALLRKKNFIVSGDRGNFMKRLIQHKVVISSGTEDILMLIDRGASLLAGNKDKAFDELAVKKYYYESVLSQADEYSALLKTWGMEMLLMKRIQPSPVSVEEAIDSIRTIDRLTSLAYGLVIPSSDIAVQVTIDSSENPFDIFK